MPDHDPLLPFVRKWEEARARGRNLTAAELCPPDRPDLLPRLAERLNQVRSGSHPAMAGLPDVAPPLGTLHGDAAASTSGPSASAVLAGHTPGATPFPDRPDPSGTFPAQIAGYKLLSQLGRGGMGAVFLAEDTKLGRRVAVKLILSDWADQPKAKARFLREARVQSQLDHPNITPLYQWGEEKGVLYVVMPLLRGETLRARLQRDRQLPLGTTLQIALEMAEGLAAAHVQGIIHRDMKPGNVWLEGDLGADDPAERYRRCRILDFGLARTVDTAGEDEPVTRTGEVVGTPTYMSPEQAAGMKVDARADLFSLGVILYEMATGVRPFEGNTNVATILNVATVTPPPAAAVNPATPPALSALIARLMAKTPSLRPPSARAVADEIRKLQDELFVPSAPPPAPADSWGDPPEPSGPDLRPPPPGLLDSAVTLKPDRPVAPPSTGTSPTVADARREPPKRLPVVLPPTRRRSAWPFVAAGAVILLTVLGGGWAYLSRRPADDLPRPGGGDALPAVTVRVNVPGAAVRANGVAAAPGDGPTVWVFRPAPAAAFTATVEKDGYTPGEVAVDTARATGYAIDLAPLTIRVTFRRLPAGAEVRFPDDPAARREPGGEFVIRRRPQTARVEAKGYRPAEVAVPLPAAGDAVEVGLTLLPAERLTNDLGMDLVLIPAGVFVMPAVSKGGRDREVTLSRPFYLGRTEVTRRQFRAFVEATQYVTAAERPGHPGGEGYTPRGRETLTVSRRFTWRDPGFSQDDDHPVVNVTWEDAKAFCDWLAEKDGRPCRLPTEAEADYAAREGEARLLPFAAEPVTVAKYANVYDAAYARRLRADNPSLTLPPSFVADAGIDDGFAFTAPVGQFAPNRFGLADTFGNALEWCEDWYGDPDGLPAVDPLQTKPDEQGRRIVRGGSWLSARKEALTGRYKPPANAARAETGFRVRVEAPPHRDGK